MTGLSLLSAVLVMILCRVLGQSETTECLSNKDCPSSRLCAEFQCINPCLLNLCDSPVNCKVTNHIPVCSSKCGPSGGSATKRGIKKFRLYAGVKLNWFSALVNCSSQGMALATIESQQENDRLIEQVKREHPELDTDGKSRWWWLGASDLMTEGVFVWTSTDKRLKYTNFAFNQPDNAYIDAKKEKHADADCIGLDDNAATDRAKNYEWYDSLCRFNMDYICEYFE